MVVRKRASAMNGAEQSRFLNVLKTLINQPGDPNPYGNLVALHANHTFNMHPFMGSVAAQRFLPWHRVFLLRVEQMGQSVDPLFFIPYWRWSVDRSVPSWLASFLPTIKLPDINRTVTRNPPRPGTTLPAASTINALITSTKLTFTQFVGNIDAPHGIVHNWCFGTMSDVSWSPVDPLFWLHHAEVDRLWSTWQQNNPGKNPTLSGANRIMSPWAETETQVRSISSLGYSYA